jgi:hypothetical protein
MGAVQPSRIFYFELAGFTKNAFRLTARANLFELVFVLFLVMATSAVPLTL